MFVASCQTPERLQGGGVTGLQGLPGQKADSQLGAQKFANFSKSYKVEMAVRLAGEEWRGANQRLLILGEATYLTILPCNQYE